MWNYIKSLWWDSLHFKQQERFTKGFHFFLAVSAFCILVVLMGME